jgi:hypothetical protein
MFALTRPGAERACCRLVVAGSRHGGRTKAAQAERRAVSKLVREARASIARLV